MRSVMGFGLVVAMVAGTTRDDGDDSLKFMLAKSELAVLGEIASEPIGIISECGVVNYNCELRIADVLKGSKPAETIQVNIVRFEQEPADRLPDLKKGKRCILFLKRAGSGEKPDWKTADMWFGLQHPSPWMARSLKRLAEAGPRAK